MLLIDAAYLLIIHNNVHISAGCSKQKPLKIDPHNGRDWAIKRFGTNFGKKWTMFGESIELSQPEKFRQLYQCCDKFLDDAIKDKIDWKGRWLLARIFVFICGCDQILDSTDIIDVLVTGLADDDIRKKGPGCGNLDTLGPNTRKILH